MENLFVVTLTDPLLMPTVHLSRARGVTASVGLSTEQDDLWRGQLVQAVHGINCLALCAAFRANACDFLKSEGSLAPMTIRSDVTVKRFFIKNTFNTPYKPRTQTTAGEREK